MCTLKNHQKYANFVDLLCEKAASVPNKIALRYFKDSETEIAHLTYQELDHKAKALAALLQEKNLTQQNVLLLFPPGLDFIVAFLGCMYAGSIPVTAYPPELNRIEHTLKRLQAILDDAKINQVLTSEKIFGMAQALMQQVPKNPLKNLGWTTTESINLAQKDQWKEPEINRESLAFLQYTSGSTGHPKGVMITQGNLLTNVEMISRGMDLKPDQEGTKIVSWLPLYHDMGLVCHLLYSLYLGAEFLFMSPLSFLKNPFNWLDLVSKHRAKVSVVPNFAYELCIRKITKEQRAKLDLSCFTLAGNSSEPVSAQTIKRFARFFKDSGFEKTHISPAYGLAEATVYVTSSRNKHHFYTVNQDQLEQNKVVPAAKNDQNKVTLVSSGRPELDGKICIVNPQTLKKCAADEVGEIWLSGSHIAKGYWNNPEATQKSFQAYTADTQEGPFFRTQDLGFLHKEDLFITGRLKDRIIIRGRNLYPHDIENQMLTIREEYPELRPGCSAAFSVEIQGEESLVLFQEIEREKNPNFDENKTIEALREIVIQNFNVNPYTIVLLQPGEIPKTSSGKVMRFACRKAFLSRFKKSDTGVRHKELLLKLKEGQAPEESLSTTASVAKMETPQSKPEEALEEKTEQKRDAQSVENLIREWIHKENKIPREEITATKSFASYGIDSVQALELSLHLEKETQISIPETALWDYQNIEELSKFLSKTKKN